MAMRRLLLSLILPTSVLAQQARVVSLRPADAKLDEEFTGITSVRELSDGRVLVTDPRDKGIAVVDFSRSTIEKIGRQGTGPGEYQMAGPLVALTGDSTLMIETRTRRILVLAGARIVATLTPESPLVLATQGAVTSADRFGHVLSRVGAAAPPRSGTRNLGSSDSGLVIRVQRGTNARDTIAAVRMPPAQITTSANAKGEIASVSIRRMPWSVGEEALLFPDGSVAVARLDPFRVDWRAPNGNWTRGAALPVPVIRMTDREKRALMDRTANSNGTAVQPPETYPDWPAVVPPFTPAPALLAAPDNRLLVLRFRSADFADTRYFVVNRRGTLDAELRLPENERIVGFGARSAYVAVADGDGIQRLERRPWPW
jgi:hypothetical protein